MDEYFALADRLPEPLRGELAALNPQIAPHVQEIRLRAGQGVQFTVKGALTPAVKYLPAARRARLLDKPALQECFLHLCRHSAYAYEEELRQGFFTLAGGCRVGVAGSWGGRGFAGITALNLRVARWVTCALPPELLADLAAPAGGILVAGAPGSGKTTMLRTMIEYMSRGDQIVCVVDERGELLAGDAAASRGIHCDAYTRCPRAQGICMALRCMNPRVIVCDELGTQADADALEQGVATGVTFLASVHCDTQEGLRRKPHLERLLRTGAFEKAVFLDGRARPGTAVRVVPLT